MNYSDEKRIGSVTLEPSGPVVAGSFGQWALIYTAGSYGIDEGGTVMLVQRTACDWQTPQFNHPDQAGFTTVTTTGNAKTDIRFQPKQSVRPWQKWCLVVDIKDGYLSPGDTITIVLGDQSQGSPGIRAQTFVESAHEFRVLVDPTNAALVTRLPSSPKFEIVAGDPVRLVCIAPTDMVVGQENAVFIKGEDDWGNPTPVKEPISYELEGDAKAEFHNGKLKAISQGPIIVNASSGGLSCRSNPLSIIKESPKYYRYWGDLHAQTESTVGTGTEEEYFAFGRDQARLDFISHQGNDFQVTDTDWKRLNDAIKRFNEPGRYVVFPGYEWSGNTATGGDHNVIYLKDDPPIFRSSHWQIPEMPEDDRTPAHPIQKLHQRLHKNGSALLIPHVGGRFADVRKFFDPDLTPLVEIVSCWGVFEWMLWDALDRGYVVGVSCNSDGHKGRPGAEHPGAGSFGIYGGLTCVLAEELTRESIFDALKTRRCYGTTGPRMALSFEANGHPMGSVIDTSDTVQIQAKVIGAAPMEALMLYKGREAVKTVRPDAFDSMDESSRIRIRWEGARIRGRARRATWDGCITLKGNRIDKALTYAFDSPADGITTLDSRSVKFNSSTTGDTDGIDLYLKENGKGRLSFESLMGSCETNIAALGDKPVAYDFGGLGLNVTIQRYPESTEETALSLEYQAAPAPGRTVPYFVKAIQEDGHMAWSSPVFIG